jgi:hypothetical protein
MAHWRYDVNQVGIAHGLDAFADEVLAILRRRGLICREYAGHTSVKETA